MIIETSANQFYRVEEAKNAGLSHCWEGYPVKQKSGHFVLTAEGQRCFNVSRPFLVRKAGCRIVKAD